MLILKKNSLIILFLLSVNSFAKSSDDVITWNISIKTVAGKSSNMQTKSYTNSDLSELVKNGAENDDINTRCRFDHEIDKISKQQSQLGITNSERIWVTCYVGDVEIGSNAVGCSKSIYSNEPVFEIKSQTFKSKGKYLGIGLSCHVPKI